MINEFFLLHMFLLPSYEANKLQYSKHTVINSYHYWMYVRIILFLDHQLIYMYPHTYFLEFINNTIEWIVAMVKDVITYKI